jgi:hypothetical protein
LPVIHGAVNFAIAGPHKHRENIVPVTRAISTPLNENINAFVEPFDGLSKPTIPGAGQPLGEISLPGTAGLDAPVYICQGIPNFMNFFSVINAAKGFRRNLKKKLHHFLVKITSFPIAPAVDLPLRKGNDGWPMHIHAFALERGLQKAPLPEPQLAIAHEQTVAEDRLVLTFEGFGEVPVALHHHIFDIPWMSHNHDVFRAETERHKVAIGTGTVGKKAGWISSKFSRMVSPGSDWRLRGVVGADRAYTSGVRSRARTYCLWPHSSALPGRM